MTRVFQSGWFAALLGAMVYLGCTVLFTKSPVPGARLEATGAAPPAGGFANAPSWEFVNPEIDQLMAELKKEREALGRREKELVDLADRLRTERLEIDQLTQAIRSLQREFDQDLVRVADEEVANCKRLARIYSAMEPTAAALILKEMEDADIVKILVFMKDEQAAPILEALSKQGEGLAKRAALISERLRLALYRDQPKQPKS